MSSTTTIPVSIYKTSIISRALHMDSSSKRITRQTENLLTDVSINISHRRIRTPKRRHTSVTSLTVNLQYESSLAEIADIAAALSHFPNTRSLTVVFDFCYHCNSLERPVDLPRLSAILPHLRSLKLVGCDKMVAPWIADTCLGLTELELHDPNAFALCRHRQESPILDTLISSNKSTLQRFTCVSQLGFRLNPLQLSYFLDTLKVSAPRVHGGAKIVGANVWRCDDPKKSVDFVQLYLADESGVVTNDYRRKSYYGSSLTTVTSDNGIETVFL